MCKETRQANAEFIKDMFKLLDKYYVRKSESVLISELEKLVNRYQSRILYDIEDLFEDLKNLIAKGGNENGTDKL